MQAMLLVHSAGEGIAVGAELVEQVLGVVALLLQALDNVCGSLGCEGGVAELAIGVGDVFFLSGDFFVEPFALGSDVDFTFVDDGYVELRSGVPSEAG